MINAILLSHSHQDFLVSIQLKGNAVESTVERVMYMYSVGYGIGYTLYNLSLDGVVSMCSK